MARSSGRKTSGRKEKTGPKEVSSKAWRETHARGHIIRKALQCQEDQVTAIDSLSNPPEEASSKWFEETLSTLRHSSDGTRAFFSAFLETRFFTERHAKGSTNHPHRIFGIAELVEQILGNLSISSLLTIRKVNRALRDAVDHSDSLQRDLHMLPNKTGFLDTPFKITSKISTLARFTCETDYGMLPPPPRSNASQDNTQSVQITAMCASKDRWQFSGPSKTSPLRQMLICHPAPKELTVYPSCCSGADWAFPGRETSPPETITSLTGFRVGDLYDETERVRWEHRLCPFASKALHGNSGYVYPYVSFGTYLSLPSDDPYYGPPLEDPFLQLAMPPAPDPDPDDEHEYIDAYIQAKQQAYAIGEPIPSLAEFEVIRVEDADIIEVFAQSKNMFDEPSEIGPPFGDLGAGGSINTGLNFSGFEDFGAGDSALDSFDFDSFLNPDGDLGLGFDANFAFDGDLGITGQ